MADLKKKLLYRMTHIENMPHILQFGITHSLSINSNSSFVPIGDRSLISRRNNYLLSNRKKLGDYIPFYFGPRTPMLYVVQKGFNMVVPTLAENIVYCITSVQKIIDLNLEFVFTDGHAVDSFTALYNKDNINDLDELLDWVAINGKYWNDENDLDRKRRKEAEFLVEGDVDASAILGFVVYNENSKSRLLDLGIEESKVIIKSTYYF